MQNSYVLSTGSALHDVRKRRGLTHMELSARSGVSQAQLSRLENNWQGIRSDVAFKLAKALGVKPFVFFMSLNDRERAFALFGW